MPLLSPPAAARAQTRAGSGPHWPRAQTYLNRAAPVTGGTPTVRRATDQRCRWPRLAGEYCGRQRTDGAL